jgi:hypothetical protein
LCVGSPIGYRRLTQHHVAASALPRAPVVVVVEVDAPTEEAAYGLVIGKMSAVLGVNWTADPG